MKTVRVFLLLVSAAQFLAAIVFFLQLPFVVGLWPFPGSTPLTFMFVASIFAAAAASTAWVAISQQYGALAGIGLDYVAILAPLSVFALQLGASSSNPALIAFGIIGILWALFGAGLLRWSVRMPLDRSRPLPNLVRASFALFVAALLIVSALLLVKTPGVIPWKITPDLSVVIGWMFFGAATYFIYGLLRPSWLNAAGQLIGFMAYDAVLVVPFLTRLSSTAPETRLGLIVYTAVVLYSGVLAIYYLFISKPTRLQARTALRHA
jgi:hypothetical protein